MLVSKKNICLNNKHTILNIYNLFENFWTIQVHTTTYLNFLAN